VTYGFTQDDRRTLVRGIFRVRGRHRDQPYETVLSLAELGKVVIFRTEGKFIRNQPPTKPKGPGGSPQGRGPGVERRGLILQGPRDLT